MKFQRGLSLNALMLGGMVLALLSLLAMKAIPPWIEYGNLVKAVKGTASDASLKDASLANVRAAFARRADMDDVKSVTAQDLDITKEGGELVISFKYEKKVPLFHNVSMVFDFEGQQRQPMNSLRLEAALGRDFGRPELLRQALTHRSYGTPHNERLEFLGDSVLNCVIANALHQRFGELKEGELSRLRASLVRQETLAGIASDLDLGDYLRLGEGELKSGGARRPSILADALEAIFGAIHLDAGYDAARGVIERLYQPAMDRIDPADAGKDPKTALQEVLQGRHLPLPRYALLATRGEAHAQEFDIECAIPELGIRTTGSGNSRRTAEQQAAQRAMAEIKP